MSIYLVRHTTPAVERGVCYGQSDLDVTDSFEQEAKIIREHLPADIVDVYTSPLQRCKKLANHLFPGHSSIQLSDHLMEINCGEWEMKKWDEIPSHETKAWMDNLINERIPGGESYMDLYKRVSKAFNHIQQLQKPAAIVTHGGVIRSILSHITQTELAESFNKFSMHYGCVIKINVIGDELHYEVLSNIPHEKETHKPSRL